MRVRRRQRRKRGQKVRKMAVNRVACDVGRARERVEERRGKRSKRKCGLRKLGFLLGLR